MAIFFPNSPLSNNVFGQNQMAVQKKNHWNSSAALATKAQLPHHLEEKAASQNENMSWNGSYL